MCVNVKMWVSTSNTLGVQVEGDIEVLQKDKSQSSYDMTMTKRVPINSENYNVGREESNSRTVL